MVDDREARFAAAEAILIKALATNPHHASAHLALGIVQVLTKRVAQGISEVERALALDWNLAGAHSFMGGAKVLVGCSAETEAHAREALRLSPQDVRAYQWLYYVGAAKLHLGANIEAVSWIRRSLEFNRNYPVAHFHLAAAV